MRLKILRNNTLSKSYGLLAALLAFLVVFPIQVSPLHYISRYGFHYMLLLFGLGIFFLLVKNNRAMLYSFLICGALNLFFKYSISGTINNYSIVTNGLPRNVESPFSLVYIYNPTLSGLENLAQGKMLDATLPDMVIVQETSLDIDSMYSDSLSQWLPYRQHYCTSNNQCWMVYSEVKIGAIDTLNIDSCQYFSIPLRLENNFYSDIVLFNLPSTEKPVANHYLGALAQHIQVQARAQVLLGNYQLVPWSPEILKLRQDALLSDTRRDFSNGFSEPPYHHVLHSKGLYCLNAETIWDKDWKSVGQIVQFSLKP